MKFKDKIRANMSVNVIGGLIGLMILFGVVVCVIGNGCLVSAFKKEYSTVTYHMADASTTFVNGNHIDAYLQGGYADEYAQSQKNLDGCCDKLNVSLVYVIKVDTSDYGSFVSVFNSVNNGVDNTNYSAWELGHFRETTNDEYKEKYAKLYNHEAEYETVFRMNPTDGSHPHITTLVPVENDKREVTALLCVQRPIREMADSFAPYFLLTILGVMVIGTLICIAGSVFIKRAIIKPIDKVSKETTRFAKENTKGEPLGEISKYEVMLNLARSIDSMETDMVQYIENLSAITAEKERIGAELSIAASIQAKSLPAVFPPFPDRNEFDLYALMDPAKEVGGDFYNFLLVDDDHLALVIADVSGKGVPAALFMMVASILISNRAQMGGTPAEILYFVNNNICDHNQSDMFVTVWLGILEISTGKLTAANAGHEYPVICRKDRSFDYLRDPHGFVIGGMNGVKFQEYEVQLKEGDKLFVYTDGLPEATNAEGKRFSARRVPETLNKFKNESPEGIIKGVRQSVSEFVGDAPQFDDLTMLCIEIKEITGE